MRDVAESAVRLRLRVSPGAARDGFAGRYGDAWKVRVAAPPERGAANRAVVRLLSSALSLPQRDVAVVSGHAGRDKIIEVRGIAPPDVERRLAAAGSRKELRP